jgi:uncharacterized protein (TIGR02186 family)
MRRLVTALAAITACLGIVAPALGAPIGDTLPRERIEVDVSSRSVAVTSSFNGTEIVVFGSVENSRQPSAESGYYDIVIVVEGAMAPIVARKKSNVGGLWVNSSSVRFASLPIFYAIVSSRPIDEIAEPSVRDAHAIGFAHVPMSVASKTLTSGVSDEELKGFREAIVRLKRKEGLYVSADYGALFIGRNLFRATVALPANIPVGPVKARVYLLRGGEVLSDAAATVTLSRQGFELLMYDFAHRQPLLYGLFCVALAVGAGLLASTLFRKGGAH